MAMHSAAVETYETSEFARKCEAIRELLAIATSDEARVRYRVGVHVLEIKSDERKYGERGVVRLSEAIERDAATLYRYALVPERWNEAAFAELLELQTARGEPLSWTHMVELAAVESDAERSALTMRAVREGLSARALASLIRDGLRPPSRTGLTRLKGIAVSLSGAKRRAMHAFELLDSVAQVSPESVSLTDVCEIEAIERELLQVLREGHQRLEALRARLTSTRMPSGGNKRTGPVQDARMPVFLSGAVPPTTNGGPRDLRAPSGDATPPKLR
jgi:hypothetical protein